MSESQHNAESESIRAYRLRVWSYCEDLQRETSPIVRSNTALYLSEAAATLARLELEEVHQNAMASEPLSWHSDAS
jgi:hypothetical protein